LTLVVPESGPLTTSAPSSVEVNRLESRDGLVQQPGQPLTKPTQGPLVSELEILRAWLDNEKVVKESAEINSQKKSDESKQEIGRNSR
jgi:hypothetical protein